MNTDSMIGFVTDPLRLTLIIAGIAVFLVIVIFGRRSRRDMSYKGRPQRNYPFVGSPPADTLVDEEVIVLPRRKTQKDIEKEKELAFSAISEEREIPATEKFVVTPFAPDVEVAVFKQNTEVKNNKAESPKTESPVEKKTQKLKPKPIDAAAQQFVVLHILAEEDNTFNGKAIFEAIQTLGMALGKHDVFHYPADAAYVGDSAFCLVNMTAEGVFDIENLDALETGGVSFILTLPTNYSDGLTVFSNMLAVAHALVNKLGGGSIVDQTRLPLTAELVISMQADISLFESQLPQSAPVLET